MFCVSRYLTQKLRDTEGFRLVLSEVSKVAAKSVFVLTSFIISISLLLYYGMYFSPNYCVALVAALSYSKLNIIF